MKEEEKQETQVDDRPTSKSSYWSSQPIDILLTATWFGLFAGLLEGFFLVGWRSYYRGGRIFISEHALWMTPLAELSVLISVGIVFAFMAWILPRFPVFSFACFAFLLLSFMALLLPIDQLHLYAKWLLSIGLAVQLTRDIRKRRSGFLSIVKFTSPALVLVLGVIAVGTILWKNTDLSSKNAGNDLVSESQPNVILITLDTVGAENLSLHGYERDTSPNLLRLAYESTVFDSAIAPSSWTLPSHASLFTGRHPNELSVGWNKPLDSSYPTLAEELKGRGYDTVGFVANYLFCSKETGLDRGIDHYDDYPVSAGQLLLSGSLSEAIVNASFIRNRIGYHNNINSKKADRLNEDFLSWLSHRERGRPFFAFLNYFDAHEPLLPPNPFDEEFGPTELKGTYRHELRGVAIVDKHSWTEAEGKLFRNAYDSSIAYLDSQIGVLLDELAKQGVLDNTILVVTSDHGEALGDRGLYGHATSLDLETLWVPLLIRFPSKMPAGKRITHPVNIRDVAATVIDLAADSPDSDLAGNSLRRFVDQRAERSENDASPILSELQEASWLEPWYPVSKGNMYSFVGPNFQYIYHESGNEEMYRLDVDPKRLENVAGLEDHKELIAECRRTLKSYLPDLQIAK